MHILPFFDKSLIRLILVSFAALKLMNINIKYCLLNLSLIYIFIVVQINHAYMKMLIIELYSCWEAGCSCFLAEPG